MRQARKHVERQRRRRRRAVGEVPLNMTVDEATLDRENYEYRWINDDQRRVFSLTERDDWDFVTDGPDREVKEDGTDLGQRVSRVVGTRRDGSELRAYLVRKPRDWYGEDQREKQAVVDRQMDALRRGPSDDPRGIGATGVAYVPAEGIHIDE